MIDSTTQVLSILIITLTLVVVAVLPRRRFALREIAAYERMPSLVGLSIESNRPLHLSFGSAGIGGESTLLTIASAELALQLAQRAAIGDASPILTVSDTSALPIAQDTLRRAYERRGRVEAYRAAGARWYPAGARSLAFAAAISAMMSDDDVSSHVMAGSFGTELALIMDNAHRKNLPIIAASDQLEGQAVAYALSSEPLIGEEIFAAPAYLGGEQGQTAESVTIDILRWILVLALLAGLVYSIITGG